MAVTPEAVEAASKRGTRLRAEYGATGVRYDATTRMVCIRLDAGAELQVSPVAVAALRGAPEGALSNVHLSPSKVGLYFPDLDVDLSIPNLVHSEDGRQIRLVRRPA